MEKLKSIEELEQRRKKIIATRDEKQEVITLCAGSACNASGSESVAARIKEEIESRGLTGTIRIRETGCHGFCERGPIIINHPDETTYLRIKPDDVAGIVESVKDNTVLDKYVYVDPESKEKIIKEQDIPFYKYQKRLVFGSNGSIDPQSLEDYLAIGGYSALSKALSDMTPESVLEEVKKSQLRGRGGGGFPAGIKWEGARNAPEKTKYVIINADEGDPGAYMDRALLEGNPHSVLEGLIIGAYAIGAQEGYVYVRQEYPLAVKHITKAIELATEYGLLGDNILGTDFSFRVYVHQGAGAFVCGESTALMTALEGKVGEPRPKYIRSNVRGLWEKPSVLNNVETWANVPLIIKNGADWFTQMGTETSKGTKIFSLVGKITNTGLVEVPMGITLNDIIFKIGGGIPKGKKFKAVQTGGPSGGCLPESLLDLQVGFDELTAAGSMMGSGGMIIMDEDNCMVDVARYFVDFLYDESCGKCVPCREGTKQMSKILTRITEGKGQEGDIELLEELSEVLKDASLCALGQTAPNPFLSTLKYFRHEYEAHIKEKRCPSGTCKALTSYYIDPEKCRACMICFKKCPSDAIDGAKKTIHVIDQEKCTRCNTCFEVCPQKFDAVKKISGEPVPEAIPEEERALVK